LRRRVELNFSSSEKRSNIKKEKKEQEKEKEKEGEKENLISFLLYT